MAVRSVIVAVVLAALAHDALADSELRVAVYAPWSGPSTPDDRLALTVAIENAFGDDTPVKVSSYAKLSDFRRQVANGAVDIAVVDSAAESAIGKKLTVGASWTSGERWFLVSGKEISSIESRTLALQGGASKLSKRFASRLLRDQIDSKFWKSIVKAPVTADARELVVRDKADLVMVPDSQKAGLKVVVELGDFSELVIATAVGNDLSDARKRVQKAVRDKLGGRWSAGKPKLPAAAAPARYRLADPRNTKVSVLWLLRSVPLELPELSADDMWIDPDAP